MNVQERIHLLRYKQETMSFNNKMGVVLLVLLVTYLFYRRSRKINLRN